MLCVEKNKKKGRHEWSSEWLNRGDNGVGPFCTKSCTLAGTFFFVAYFKVNAESLARLALA